MNPGGKNRILPYAYWVYSEYTSPDLRKKTSIITITPIKYSLYSSYTLFIGILTNMDKQPTRRAFGRAERAKELQERYIKQVQARPKTDRELERILKECTKMTYKGTEIYLETSQMQRFQVYSWQWKGKKKDQLCATASFTGTSFRLDMSLARYIKNIHPSVPIKIRPRFANKHIYHSQAFILVTETEDLPIYPPYTRQYHSPFHGVYIEHKHGTRGIPIKVQAIFDVNNDQIEVPIYDHDLTQHLMNRERWAEGDQKVASGQMIYKNLKYYEREAAKAYDKALFKRDGPRAQTNFLSSIGVGLEKFHSE